MDELQLLPYPRSVTIEPGQHLLQNGRRMILQGGDLSEPLLKAAQRLQVALRKHAGVDWEIGAVQAGAEPETGAIFRMGSGSVEHAQGYDLRITPELITVQAQAAPGVFYAICTLIQLIEQFGGRLPCTHIVDWPDFAARGMMLDISRDKVPRMETVRELIDMLAGWKINQVQLYTEHTFAYHNHPEVWATASPFTGQEILELDAFCHERFIELVPNQNSFGHMQRWLVLPRYAGLAEIQGEFMTPWGPMEGPFSLNPTDEGSIALVRDLYDELLPHFRSRMFNVGCDETFDLGQGQSKAACEERGIGRVYLEFLQQIYAEVQARGHTMQFWGDIIMEHPSLIDELPKDSIALEWGYEADHPFAEHCPRFEASGIPFYVCPGTSAWCSIAGRTANALGNLLSAAENGRKHGAVGYLMTDWGDNGHWQVLPVSYLGFAAGAAYAWACDANKERDMAAAVSRHAFKDPSGAMGRVAYDLGNVYQTGNLAVPNGSLLFWVLQLGLERFERFLGRVPDRPLPNFVEALAAIDAALLPLQGARMEREDAALILREFELTARLLRHACRRGQMALADSPIDNVNAANELKQEMPQIIHEYTAVWLERNRLGGLRDSVARFEKTLVDYGA